jgi:hypothetical protein
MPNQASRFVTTTERGSGTAITHRNATDPAIGDTFARRQEQGFMLRAASEM